MTTRDTPDFISGLTDAARDNPLAAVLIGGGALWMLLGGRGLSAFASVARPAGEAGARVVRDGADALSSGASQLGESVMGAARSATDSMMGAARSATQAAGDGFAQAGSSIASSVGSMAQHSSSLVPSIPDPRSSIAEGYHTAESMLSDMLKRQPLVLGAVGLAVGASVASAFASLQLERDYMGQASDDLKDAVAKRATTAATSAGEAAVDIGEKFASGAAEAAARLKGVGRDTLQSVKEEIRS